MTHTSLHFQIEQLRGKNTLKTLESIAVFMLALVVALFLPSLLARYVYAGQQLFEQPKSIEYIPVVSFVISVAFFIFTMIGNLIREMKARRLEQEAMTVWATCDDCGCATHSVSSDDLSSAMNTVAARRTVKTKKISRRK